MKLICISAMLMLALNSCTYSISMQHSEGSTDTVEEEQTANPNIAPNLTLPLLK